MLDFKTIVLPEHRDTTLTITGTCYFGIRNRYVISVTDKGNFILKKKFNWFKWEHAVCQVSLIDDIITEAESIVFTLDNAEKQQRKKRA